VDLKEDPMDDSILATCGEVLRSPEAVVERGGDRAAFARLVPRLLGVTIFCAAVFGAVAGSYRGGEQIAFAAVKMPLVFLVPLVAALPATRALYQASDVEVDSTRLALAGLVGTARTALLAAGAAPVLWLLYSFGVSYHLAIVALAGVLVLVGTPGLFTVVRAIPGRAPLAALGAMLILGVVTAQTGWVLRPFVARPRAEVAFLRPLEGNVTGSLLRAPLAASEIYLDYEPARSPWRGSE
jgi:hypothetical protein